MILHKTSYDSDIDIDTNTDTDDESFKNDSQIRNGGNTMPSQSQSPFDPYNDYNHQTGLVHFPIKHQYIRY